jgi:amino acid permease
MSATRLLVATAELSDALVAEYHTVGEYSAIYWVYTFLFIGCSYWLALSVSDLGKVMALVGATGSTSVSYILPGAMYWNLHPQPHAKRYGAGLMFVVGACIVPLALSAILS